jgi:hypothetical protein
LLSAEETLGSAAALVLQDAAAADAAEEGTLLEAWIELLRARKEAEAACTAAQQEAGQAQAECGEELEEVEGRIAELEAQLALGELAADGGGASSGGSQQLRYIQLAR